MLQLSALIFLFLSSNTLASDEQLISIINLSDEEIITVDSIIVTVINAFENAKTHTTIEKKLFALGNKLRYITKKNTIKKYLLFKERDSISKTILIESERNLRRQAFFADAIIKLKKKSNQFANAHITVFDQWSTVPILGIKRVGNNWTHRFGIRENNLLGTGQTISFSHYKNLSTEGNTFYYYNSSITKYKLKYQLRLADNQNGYFLSSLLYKPLISKYDKNSFKIHYTTYKYSLLYYLDGNILQNLLQETFNLYEANSLIEFNNIYENYLFLDLIKSYGFNKKIDLHFFSILFNRKHNLSNYNPINNNYQNYIPENLIVPGKNDVILGIKLKLYQNEYAQTKNLNNFKWTENLNKIKSISFSIGKNIPDLGANNDNIFIRWDATYSNFLNDKHFILTKSNLHFLLTPLGEKEDGEFDFSIRYQYRFTSLTNGKISTYWKHFIGKPHFEQLLLGESTGLYGYPNFYYSGDAMLLIKSELTMITDFEIFTVIPAISIFTTTGNTFTGNNYDDLYKLHSSIGFGFRFGLTRSAGSIVNHINFSWPIHNSIIGPSISFHSMNSL